MAETANSLQGSLIIEKAGKQHAASLQRVQARCPQGGSVEVESVNAPDFFARAKAYEDWQVYLARQGEQVLGSAAYGLRTASLGGEPVTIGHVFQVFVDPGARKKGVAHGLLQQIEQELRAREVSLSYALILEGNQASMGMMKAAGFKPFADFTLSTLPVYQKLQKSPAPGVRTAQKEDLAAIAGLLNRTWQGFELFAQVSADDLARFIERTPAYDLDQLYVLERQGRIAACVGYWDWSRISRVKVLKLSPQMQLMRMTLALLRLFKPMPPMVRAGEVLKQLLLSPMGFEDARDLGILIRHLNDLALASGYGWLFVVQCPGKDMTAALKGFMTIDTRIHLYIKPLTVAPPQGGGPVFIDGIDF